MPRTRQGTRRLRSAPAGRRDAPRRMPVGRAVQARLIALEKRIGLFAQEASFAADSRFNHAVVLPADAPLPAGMASLFAEDVAALERLGKPARACHAAGFGPYRVCCVAFFHYDGFRALVYVERDGRLVAAWKEEEVLQPDTPRAFFAGVDDSELEAFLEQIGEG